MTSSFSSRRMRLLMAGQCLRHQNPIHTPIVSAVASTTTTTSHFHHSAPLNWQKHHYWHWQQQRYYYHSIGTNTNITVPRYYNGRRRHYVSGNDTSTIDSNVHQDSKGSAASSSTNNTNSSDSTPATPLLYTAPPFPHYQKTLSAKIIKLLLNSSVSLIGTASTLFIGGNPLTIAMAFTPVFWIWRAQNEIRALLKEVNRIYYVPGVVHAEGDASGTNTSSSTSSVTKSSTSSSQANQGAMLKILLFRKDSKQNEMVEYLPIGSQKQKNAIKMPATINHDINLDFQQTWKLGSTPYRIDSHGVIHNQDANLPLNRDLFLNSEVRKSVFHISRADMDTYGFVKVAPVAEFEKLTDWKAKWHVIVDNEIHLLLMKPYEQFFAVDAFCHRGHALSAGKVKTEFIQQKTTSQVDVKRIKHRMLKCSKCSRKSPTVIDLQKATLPVKVIDGYVCIRVDSIYQKVHGGQDFLEHTLRDHMTLEEFLSFYSIYK